MMQSDTSLRKNHLIQGFSNFCSNKHLLLIVLAICIGIIVALAVVAILAVIDYLQTFFFGAAEPNMTLALASLPWWQILAVPAFGGLASSLVIYFLIPEGRPQGPAEVIEVAAKKKGGISFRSGFGAITASCLSIGCGASVGREGPAIHFAASLASWSSRCLGLGQIQTRTLLGCATAAAVSASFNAPLAGIVFAHEVVLGHYGISAFAPVVIASIAGVVSIHNLLGNTPLFDIPLYSIASYWEFPAFAVVGLVSGVIAWLMVSAIIFIQQQLRTIAIPVWIFPTCAGVAVGLLAIWFPHVLGVGYQATDSILHNEFLTLALLGLLLAKILATVLSLGCGFAGGIFSPSLVIGATIGAICAALASYLLPEFASQPQVYALVGMAAFASATLGAPFSTSLIVFELTGDYDTTIAVLFSSVLASLIMRYKDCHSFFLLQLKTRGIDISDYAHCRVLSELPISLAVEPAYSIALEATRAEAMQALRQSDSNMVCVTDQQRLHSVILLSDLSSHIDSKKTILNTAGELGEESPCFLLADDDMDKAQDMFHASNQTQIPVVDSAETMRLIGLIRESTMLRVYARELNRKLSS